MLTLRGAFKDWVDFDGDGLDDIVSLAGGGTQVAILNRDLANGTFGPMEVFGGGVTPRDLVAADVDGNGRSDLIMLSATSPTLNLVGRITLLLNQTVTSNVGVTPIPSRRTSFVVHAQPNPAAGPVRLSWSGTSDAPVDVVLLDVGGRVIHRQRFAGRVQGPLLPPGSRLPAGLYFVRATRGADTATTRLCVVR